MQVCKFCKPAAVICISVLLNYSLMAESIEMPEMPSMPDMPSVSNPSLDGSFYKPSMPANGTTSKKEETSVSSSNLNSAVLKDATTTDNLLSSFINTNSNLTASDISTLYDSGLFTDLSSLTGLLGTSSGTSSADSTNLLLNQILTSLEELKADQKDASAAEKQSLSNYQQDSETFKKREPSILRFKVNGYSITESFTNTFFSEPESDGTFLLTADRRYYANQKPREETVYVLFKAVKSRGSSVVYQVQPSVVQTTKNDQSFLYKFSQMKELSAEKTGNLVTLHSSEDDVTVDLLLDIDM